MADMLVNLYQLPDSAPVYERTEKAGIKITRALSPNMHKVLDFVRREFGEGWTSETFAAFANHPTTCFVASRDGEVIGFADYDATAKGYFGPTGVLESQRNQGIGAALLLKCLEAMREDGYGYAIIGSAGPEHFYELNCGARVIENDTPNVYSRMV
ncbi:MAG: GNAT family N-acetyltransferase [Lachnospiraceae bacterium]|nr:GNAT family N-acetyltransferase [Lachnospiraceae bacterium]